MSVELFIGSLPYGASSQAVSRFLWDWVVPESAHVIMDRATGRPKSFGLVVVDGPEDAVAACRADAAEMDGCRLTVSVARSPLSQARAMSRVEEYLKHAAATPHEAISFSSLQQEFPGRV
jgi:cold-inducible RNA-binding protein